MHPAMLRHMAWTEQFAANEYDVPELWRKPQICNESFHYFSNFILIPETIVLPAKQKTDQQDYIRPGWALVFKGCRFFFFFFWCWSSIWTWRPMCRGRSKSSVTECVCLCEPSLCLCIHHSDHMNSLFFHVCQYKNDILISPLPSRCSRVSWSVRECVVLRELMRRCMKLQTNLMWFVVMEVRQIKNLLLSESANVPRTLKIDPGPDCRPSHFPLHRHFNQIHWDRKGPHSHLCLSLRSLQ